MYNVCILWHVATKIKSRFGGQGWGSFRGLSLKIAILASLNCRIVTGPDVNWTANKKI